MKKKISEIFKSKKKKTWITLGIILIILIVAGLMTASVLDKKDSGEVKPGKTLSKEAASAKAEQFINDFLMTSGSKATIKDITSEYGLYKLKIDIVTDVVESYMTKDGKLFFPQALDIDKIYASKNQAANTNSDSGNSTQSATVSKKNGKPVVELFVMSYCPYGTQMEKAILPVVKALGDKIDFELKFCSYSMHGEKELDEQLTQYCIQKDSPSKFDAYLECFLGSGDSASCLKSSGVDQSDVSSCVSKTDSKYKVTENYNSKTDYQGSYPGFAIYKADNDKYSVQGSPTLVINGEEIQANRDSASLLKTICSAFDNAPEECSAQLSSSTPSTGFGYGNSGSANSASCN